MLQDVAIFAASLMTELIDSALIDYLRRAHFVSPAQIGKSLLLSPKRKIRNARKDIPFVLPCSNHSYLNYAPDGAIFAASLTSELVDSALLDYLRRTHCVSRAQRSKSLLLQKAEKDSHNVTVFFWRSRRDLNSRAGIADLHP